MRNTEAIRKVLKGDIGIAQSYMGLARKFLGIFDNVNNLPGAWEATRTLTNGTIIKVGAYAGQKYIKITAGEEEVFEAIGLGCLPATDVAPNGWGTPYTTANRPLGTIGGDYPEVIIRPQRLAGELPPEKTRIFRTTRSDNYINTGFPNAEEYKENTLLYANIDWRGDRRDRVLTYTGPRSRYFPEFRLDQIVTNLDDDTSTSAIACRDPASNNFGINIGYVDGGIYSSSFESNNDAWQEKFDIENETEFGDFLAFSGPRFLWFGGSNPTPTSVVNRLYLSNVYQSNVYRNGVQYPTLQNVMGAAIQVEQVNNRDKEFLNYVSFDYDENRLKVYRRDFENDLTSDVVIHDEQYTDDHFGHMYPWFFNSTGTEARSFRFKQYEFTLTSGPDTFNVGRCRLEEVKITIDPEGRTVFAVIDPEVTGRCAVDYDGNDWVYMRYEGNVGQPRFDDGTKIFDFIEREGVPSWISYKTGTLATDKFTFDLTETWVSYYVDLRNKLSLYNSINYGFFTEIQDWKWNIHYGDENTVILSNGPVSASIAPFDRPLGQISECQLYQEDGVPIFPDGTWWLFWRDVQLLDALGAYPNPKFSVILPYDKKTITITQTIEDLFNKGTAWQHHLFEVSTDLVRDTKIIGDNPRFYPANIL